MKCSVENTNLQGKSARPLFHTDTYCMPMFVREHYYRIPIPKGCSEGKNRNQYIHRLCITDEL